MASSQATHKPFYAPVIASDGSFVKLYFTKFEEQNVEPRIMEGIWEKSTDSWSFREFYSEFYIKTASAVHATMWGDNYVRVFFNSAQ
ncbi:hypothetical protein H072_1546 [Dactylellina haptotyla CBS 200.50]|uniref:Uncharacterized protein n=1 Tax=Dactylellina haptotyla (strain CBS 200.50) TaxID=1284197 RepID=S8AU29_DACHA|nr:hypothetical protein H072_1546 [Dactylellina haptotyla CBS 200.50]